ncbi:MAG: hypothetical protein ACFE9C_01380 [Candidatus Hodarchaeota archaeon]
MEIEKTRETSWKIQLKNKNENIEITSVEISGEVRLIKLALLNNDKTTKVEMNKEEFFNFLSLISAFKDVVIGEESLTIEEEMDYFDDYGGEIQQNIQKIDENSFQLNSDNNENNIENDEEELNPEEWDPW